MKERDLSIDTLRGLAIFTMIAANMSAESLVEPHSFGFRIYGSFAAPIFIFLSGFMTGKNSLTKAYSFSYFLKRGTIVILIAALIDVFFWEVLPFMTFDVLYVIGIGLPFSFIVTKLPLLIRYGIISILLLGAIPLQMLLGYQEYPLEVYFLEENDFSRLVMVKSILRQLFIDGWFPLFPWLGYALLGNELGRFIHENKSFNFLKLRVISAVLIVMGILIWWMLSPELYIREGFSELFYPPTIGFILVSIGVILLLLKVNYFNRINPMAYLGQSSMLMYITHIALIVFLLPIFGCMEDLQFTLVYLGISLILVLIAYFNTKWKRPQKWPLFLKIIFG